MSRLPDWIDRYVAFRNSLRSKDFEFSKHDCCISACNEILAITGTDPAQEFRDKYNSPIAALKIVKEYGDVDGIAEVVCAKFGWPQCNLNFANRCDLVCIDVGGERKALGWLDLDATRILAPALIGLQSVPRDRALRAWRID